MENLREEIERLKDCLKEKKRQIPLLREKLDQKDDLKAAMCPNCGCEKVYKKQKRHLQGKAQGVL